MDKTPEEGSIYVFAGIDKARFRSRVGPNDKVHLYSTVVSEKKGIWKFDTRAEVDNKVVCSASILCADRKAIMTIDSSSIISNKTKIHPSVNVGPFLYYW